MLSAPAPFPHVGSEGFLAPTAEKVRILRRNADGTMLIKHFYSSLHPTRHRDASGNSTVDARKVHKTEKAALPKVRRRRRKA